VSRINYGVITLLPKIKEAEKIQQFRPICLLNCLYKIVTKVQTIRLEKVAEKLFVQPNCIYERKKHNDWHHGPA
jgi:hypothetical protein